MTDGLYGLGGPIRPVRTEDGDWQAPNRHRGELLIGEGTTEAYALHDLAERMQQLDERAEDGDES